MADLMDEQRKKIAAAFRKLAISGYAEHRAFLSLCMQGVISGQVSIAQGNCVKGLSEEIHKNLRAQSETLQLTSQNMAMGEGNQILMIEAPDENA